MFLFQPCPIVSHLCQSIKVNKVQILCGSCLLLWCQIQFRKEILTIPSLGQNVVRKHGRFHPTKTDIIYIYFLDANEQSKTIIWVCSKILWCRWLGSIVLFIKWLTLRILTLKTWNLLGFPTSWKREKGGFSGTLFWEECHSLRNCHCYYTCYTRISTAQMGKQDTPIKGLIEIQPKNPDCSLTKWRWVWLVLPWRFSVFEPIVSYWHSEDQVDTSIHSSGPGCHGWKHKDWLGFGLWYVPYVVILDVQVFESSQNTTFWHGLTSTEFYILRNHTCCKKDTLYKSLRMNNGITGSYSCHFCTPLAGIAELGREQGWFQCQNTQNQPRFNTTMASNLYCLPYGEAWDVSNIHWVSQPRWCRGTILLGLEDLMIVGHLQKGHSLTNQQSDVQTITNRMAWSLLFSHLTWYQYCKVP